MRSRLTSPFKLGALSVAVLAFATTACWPFDDDELSRMTIERREGTVEVIRDDETVTVADQLTLKPGDEIEVSSDGLARLQLESGRLAQLGSSTQALVVDTTTLDTRMGHVLADANSPMMVRFGSVKAEVSDAVFRLDLSAASTTVGSYEGEVKLSVPGQPRLQVRQLHEATVAADTLPDRGSPYQLDSDDDWDREYLGDVLDLDEELARLAASFSSQAGRQKPSTDFFAAVAGNRNAEFMRPYLKRRIPATDLLIGFTIANADNGPLDRSVRKAFGLYRAGARWGVAAAIMLRERAFDPLVAQVKTLFLATDVVAGGAGGDADFTLAGGAEIGTGDDPGDPGNPGPGDPGDPDPKDKDDPDPKPSPKDCEDLVDCGAEEVQEEVDKLRPSPSPSPSLLEDVPIIP